MSVKPPNSSELSRIASELGFSFDSADVEFFRGLLDGALRGYDPLDKLPDALPEPRYPRLPGRIPSVEENPFGGFARVVEIPGATQGPLAGRTIVVKDDLVRSTIRALARSDNDSDTLWSYEQDGRWHALHSRDVGNYIAVRAGGHFTAKEFRTWNATVLMALALANAGPAATLTGRKRTIAASVREVANLLGDTPAVARGSYIDPRLIARYEADGVLPTVPPDPVALPVTPEAESAVAALLALSD